MRKTFLILALSGVSLAGTTGQSEPSQKDRAGEQTSQYTVRR